MSDVTTQLVIGAQQGAAQLVAGSAPTLRQALADLVQGIEAEQHQFQGKAAGAFYSALSGWLKLGSTIPEATMAYAGKLVQVDRGVAESQLTQSNTYQRVAGSLSAWSFE